MNVDAPRFRATAEEEAAVCVAIVEAPLTATSEQRTGGDWSTVCQVEGALRHEDETQLSIDDARGTALVRHLLPSSIDLGPLEGIPVVLRVEHTLHRARLPTVDATLRDATGRLLLWAHDGRLPRDGRIDDFAVRIEHASLRLALRRGGVVALGAARTVVEVGSQHCALVLRVGADDAAFVVVRGRAG